MTTKTMPSPLTINISEEAAGHVRVFAAQSGKPDSNLRVAVKGGGCAGMTYVLDLIDDPREGDKVIEEHGIRLFVDRKSYIFLAGTILEYSRRTQRQGASCSTTRTPRPPAAAALLSAFSLDTTRITEHDAAHSDAASLISRRTTVTTTAAPSTLTSRLMTKAATFDMSHFGRLSVSGDDAD